MCILSVISNYSQERFDRNVWNNPSLLEAFRDLIDSAKRFDMVAEQPDCIDSEKDRFLKEILGQEL